MTIDRYNRISVVPMLKPGLMEQEILEALGEVPRHLSVPRLANCFYITHKLM